mmetsp:Transcript_37259/g.89042  ORF Transcript_37259/g.89042 Transcript_37259/m.89042 type:complete len:277 (-) Transcript_37259:2415-3245(-)
MVKMFVVADVNANFLASEVENQASTHRLHTANAGHQNAAVLLESKARLLGTAPAVEAVLEEDAEPHHKALLVLEAQQAPVHHLLRQGLNPVLDMFILHLTSDLCVVELAFLQAHILVEGAAPVQDVPRDVVHVVGRLAGLVLGVEEKLEGHDPNLHVLPDGHSNFQAGIAELKDEGILNYSDSFDIHGMDDVSFVTPLSTRSICKVLEAVAVHQEVANLLRAVIARHLQRTMVHGLGHTWLGQLHRRVDGRPQIHPLHHLAIALLFEGGRYDLFKA